MLGLTDAAIRRFRLGLREPYASRATGAIIERALAFPVLSTDWARNGRWSYAVQAAVAVAWRKKLATS